MVVVQIKGVPETFDSITEKYEFLLGLYADLLELAEEIGDNDINFVVDRTYH